MEDSQVVYMCGSLLLGGAIFGLLRMLFLALIEKRQASSRSNDTIGKICNLDARQVEQPKYQESSHTFGSNKGNKRQSKNKKRKETQQFSHPWLVGTLKGHTDTVLDMQFSANGKFLASCAEDRTVLIWCTKNLSSKERKTLRINIEYDYASLVRWSPDSKAFIIHKSLANHIEVYKIMKKSDGTIASATKSLSFPRQHQDDIVGMDIACNGRFILTCSKRNDLLIWDLKGQVLGSVDTYLGSTHRARVSPCGRFVAASGFTPDVKIWEVAFSKSGEFKHITKCFDLAGHSSGVYDFAINADTSRMVTVSKDGTLRMFDTKVEFEKSEDPHLLSVYQWNSNTPASIALSPNAEVIVVAHGSSLSFYSTISQKLDAMIEDIFNGPIKCLTFDSLGEYILAAGDKQIKIFRNIPGYKASIEAARKKLLQKQTSATRERLEKIIVDYEKLLANTEESIS